MDAVENEDFDIQLCYLLVLAETKTAQILTAFLNKGGWPTLARWLNGYIEQKHFVGIRQLVKTYRSLPVTPNILKKPIETGKMPGKMIRSLRKHDDEVIKGNGSDLSRDRTKRLTLVNSPVKMTVLLTTVTLTTQRLLTI